eukprot:CAMPEP_0167753998 /NCGR_PEP_ID=MMETSP0110_2-20121227/8027_1 /TAXON_ID=629695 /ORGANISM="Gymnochlora sp., Strain CCMP2014" /LENGTH=113 /DNA_ID=CAMNT_0007639831 /DNA_START=113 /DNA_END=454 /DNA_ORIENTATION=+
MSSNIAAIFSPSIDEKVGLQTTIRVASLKASSLFLHDLNEHIIPATKTERTKMIMLAVKLTVNVLVFPSSAMDGPGFATDSVCGVGITFSVVDVSNFFLELLPSRALISTFVG